MNQQWHRYARYVVFTRAGDIRSAQRRTSEWANLNKINMADIIIPWSIYSCRGIICKPVFLDDFWNGYSWQNKEIRFETLMSIMHHRPTR